jgi:hypothetical protein
MRQTRFHPFAEARLFRNRKPIPWILLLYIVLVVVMTWPLTANLGRNIIGPFYGDNLEYTWKIWWFKHALVDLQQTPWIQPELFYPYGYPLAYGEVTPIHTYLGILATLMFGPVSTYNLFIILSTILSGYFTFLLVRELTGNAAGGIVAGIIFAFCPYRMARIAGHLPLVDTQWLPLVFLFTERFFCRRRWQDAALAGVFYSASALSSWYYGIMLALLIPVYVLARVERPVAGNRRRYALGGLAFLGVSCVLVTPFLLPYGEVMHQGTANIPLEQAALWSASLTDYATPNPRHFLWGDWVRNRLSAFAGDLPYEFILTWGVLPTLLAISGWRFVPRPFRRGLGWWIGVSIVLSLGPVLKLFGFVPTLPLPTGFAEIVNNGLDWLGTHSIANESYALATAGRSPIPLPALALRWFLPGIAGMRSWGRFAIFATFGVAVLAGAGFEALFGRIERVVTRPFLKWRWGVAGLVAGLVLFEFYPGPAQLITPGPRPVDNWLAAQPERHTIVQLPLAVALSGPQMYYSMHHGQRMISGYGTYLPILFEEQFPELASFPSAESLDLLANWEGEGVDYVLLDTRDVPSNDPFWDAIEAQDRLDLIETVDEVRIYQVK